MSTPRISFLKELRDAALRCTNPDTKRALQTAADQLQVFMDYFQGGYVITADDMRGLNGAWTFASRVLRNVPAEADPQPPLSGAPEAARLAA